MLQSKPVPAGDNWITKDISEFCGSPVSRIRDEWMLITAESMGASGPRVSGTDAVWNTMTASWGGLGVLWGKDVAFMFIRPSRYTFEFANASPVFTLSFFDEAYHGALAFCGANSGRDMDKAAATELTPIFFDDGGFSFLEASDIITCQKLYTHDFDPSVFLDPSIEKNYPRKDYHRMFIGEIIQYRIQK